MSISSKFMLDPEIVFLNHGSFGATPKPVFENYQYWQKRLEFQPVKFLGREFNDLLLFSRITLGEYIHAKAQDLVFIPNTTFGVNLIAHSLNLKKGDEILTTDHEYGACDLVWEHVCEMKGAVYKKSKIPFPLNNDEEIIAKLFEGYSRKTKYLFISHITSSTAIILPIEKICRKARELGIISIIDGAHTPGQLEINLQNIGADIYIGNCHKWLMSPKGAGFLYCTESMQELIEPLVVSWGSGMAAKTNGTNFIEKLQWTGTNDPAAYLSVPAAIQFAEENNWIKVKEKCHNLLESALVEIQNLTGLQAYYEPSSTFYYQMATARIPDYVDLEKIKNILYDQYNIEVPFTQLSDKKLIRISIQGYNTENDIERLIVSLKKVIS